MNGSPTVGLRPPDRAPGARYPLCRSSGCTGGGQEDAGSQSSHSVAEPTTPPPSKGERLSLLNETHSLWEALRLPSLECERTAPGESFLSPSGGPCFDVQGLFTIRTSDPGAGGVPLRDPSGNVHVATLPDSRQKCCTRHRLPSLSGGRTLPFTTCEVEDSPLVILEILAEIALPTP